MNTSMLTRGYAACGRAAWWWGAALPGRPGNLPLRSTNNVTDPDSQDPGESPYVFVRYLAGLRGDAMEDKQKANQAVERARLRAMESLERVLKLLAADKTAETATTG
jgi:hypothetical protein